MRCSIPVVDSMQCNILPWPTGTRGCRFSQVILAVSDPTLRLHCSDDMLFIPWSSDFLINKLNLRTMHPEKGSYYLMGRACQSAERARE